MECNENNKMSYEEFVLRLSQTVSESLQISEDRIQFEPVDGSKEDRLVIVYEKESRNYGMSIHIYDLYEKYVRGNRNCFEKISQNLCVAAKNTQMQPVIKIPDFSELTYDEVKGNLFIRLLNIRDNKNALKEAVYCQIGDVAITLYYYLEIDNTNIFRFKIPNGFLDFWKIGTETVIEQALENTMLKFEPQIYAIENVTFKELAEEIFERISFMQYEISYDFSPYGTLLSTDIHTEGAVSIFLPGVADRLAQLMDTNFYFVFLSVHEVMIHAEKSVSPCDISSVMEDMAQVDPEVFLSSRVYHYDRDTKQFTVIDC